MHYARRQPTKEAANGAREDKYMARMRFRKWGGEGREEGERRRGEGTEEKERFGKERAGTRGGGHTGRRDVLDGEGTQRRKLNGEAREREREKTADGTGPRPNMIIEYGERCEHSTL